MTENLNHLSKAELIARLEKMEEECGQSGHRESRVAQDALRDSEERIRAIVETAVEGIVTINTRGIIESVNPAIERMFGYTPEELIGRNVSILMPSPYREQHDGYLNRYLQTGVPRIIGIGREVVGQRKDGSIFPMDLSVGEFQMTSGRMFAGILRDITERKRLEREVLEISDREQQRIGQDLHDGICQQLVGIELVCQTLEEDLLEIAPPLAGQAREIARHVRDAITQTRGLAHGLTPVNVQSEGFHVALRELTAKIQRLSKVQCDLSMDETAAPPNQSTATHLYRITQESMSNAIRHGKATEIQISLDREQKGILLRIRDNGTGIKPSPEGSHGMGLRIMEYRAGMIGGTIKITSDSGGTTVSCHLPAPAYEKN